MVGAAEVSSAIIDFVSDVKDLVRTGALFEQDDNWQSPEALRSNIRANKLTCAIVGVVTGMLALAMPAESEVKMFFTILFCSTLYHGVFLLWCDDTNPEVLKARYSHYVYHIMMTCFILLFACGDSHVLFVRGVMFHLVPVGFCITFPSVKQVSVFMVAHFVVCLYKSKADLLGERAQALAVTVLLDAMLLDVCLIRAGMGGVNKSLKAATDVFRSMLSFMCDGYLIMNKHSDILAMDPKAADIMLPQLAEPGDTLNFNALLHDSSSSNIKDISPGMGSGRLLAPDGRDFQIETYTCNCDLLSEGLKWIVEVSNKHYQAKVQAALQCNEDIYLRAIRIISESFNRAPSVASSKKSYNMSDISSLHSVTTYSLGGAGPQENSNLHQSLSLGEQVEMTLAVLANPNSSMFATERENPDFPEILQSMHNSFRTLITDALAQTAEQVRHFPPLGTGQ